MAQNDTHVALIILTTQMWGGGGIIGEKKFSGQILCSCAFGANIRSYTKQRARHGTPFLQPPPLLRRASMSAPPAEQFSGCHLLVRKRSRIGCYRPNPGNSPTGWPRLVGDPVTGTRRARRGSVCPAGDPDNGATCKARANGPPRGHFLPQIANRRCANREARPFFDIGHRRPPWLSLRRARTPWESGVRDPAFHGRGGGRRLGPILDNSIPTHPPHPPPPVGLLYLVRVAGPRAVTPLASEGDRPKAGSDPKA